MRLGKTNSSKLDCFALNFAYICIMYVSLYLCLYLSMKKTYTNGFRVSPVGRLIADAMQSSALYCDLYEPCE